MTVTAPTSAPTNQPSIGPAQAFDEAHVDVDRERTGTVLYLHEVAQRVRAWGGRRAAGAY